MGFRGEESRAHGESDTSSTWEGSLGSPEVSEIVENMPHTLPFRTGHGECGADFPCVYTNMKQSSGKRSRHIPHGLKFAVEFQ